MKLRYSKICRLGTVVLLSLSLVVFIHLGASKRSLYEFQQSRPRLKHTVSTSIGPLDVSNHTVTEKDDRSSETNLLDTSVGISGGSLSSLQTQFPSETNSSNTVDPFSVFQGKKCLHEDGSYSQWNAMSEKGTCEVLVVTSYPDEVESLLEDPAMLSVDCPPTILLLNRRGLCTPLYGSVSLLMHPRIYWVASDILCFGDSFASTSVFPSLQLQALQNTMADIRKQVLTFSVILPSSPAAWTSWKLHLHMTRNSSQESTIETDLNSQYKQVLVPKFENNWESPGGHCKLCEENLPIPELPWKVAVTASCNGHWLVNKLSSTIQANISTIRFEAAKGLDDANIVFFCLGHGLDIKPAMEAKSAGKLAIVLSEGDRKNNALCGALNVNTWSTSDCMSKATGIPLALPPKALLKDGTLQHPQRSQGGPKLYFASFMGTHVKDGSKGSNGIVRHLLRQLNDERNGFIIYTRCHAVHEGQCQGSDEKERLYHFSRQLSYNYTDLLENSMYCLTPKGRQPASYRFLETLLHGCIPVYVSDPGDNFMFSFFESSKIPWEKTSFYIHGFSIGHLKEFLHSISTEEWEDKQNLTGVIAETYFSSMEQIASNFLMEVQQKLEKKFY